MTNEAPSQATLWILAGIATVFGVALEWLRRMIMRIDSSKDGEVQRLNLAVDTVVAQTHTNAVAISNLARDLEVRLNDKLDKIVERVDDRFTRHEANTENSMHDVTQQLRKLSEAVYRNDGHK